MMMMMMMMRIMTMMGMKDNESKVSVCRNESSMSYIIIIALLQMLILSTRSLLSAAVRRRTLRNMSSSLRSHSSVVELSPTLSSQLNDPSLLTDWDPSITDKTQFFHVNNPAATSSSTQQTSLARIPSLHDIVPETLVTSHQALETQWRDATTASIELVS
jgi:hypothetical protein